MQSLSESLNKCIDASIKNYIKKVSEKYSLNEIELYELWSENKNTSSVKSRSKSDKKELASVDLDDTTPERILKCTKNELQALCRTRGLKVTGTKEQLVERLLGKEVREEKKEKKEKKTSKEKETVKKSSKESKKTTSKQVSQTSLLKKLNSEVQTLAIRRNAFGNLEHPETHFVFDKETKKVFGKQLEDGKISDLTAEDIEECKKFKFNYNIPVNLNKKEGLDKVKVQEVEEEVEEEVETEEDVVEDVEDVEEIEEEDE